MVRSATFLLIACLVQAAWALPDRIIYGFAIKQSLLAEQKKLQVCAERTSKGALK